VARPQPSPRAQACPVPARHCDARVSTLHADARGLRPQRLLALGGRQPAETLGADPAGPGAVGGRAARGPEAGFHSVLSDMCHATLGVSAADALRSHELAACAVDLALGAGAGGAAPAPAPAAGPAPGDAPASPPRAAPGLGLALCGSGDAKGVSGFSTQGLTPTAASGGPPACPAPLARAAEPSAPGSALAPPSWAASGQAAGAHSLGSPSLVVLRRA